MEALCGPSPPWGVVVDNAQREESQDYDDSFSAAWVCRSRNQPVRCPQFSAGDEVFPQKVAAWNMGKKIHELGRYVMDGVLLGKGNFARVELATHSVTSIKVCFSFMTRNLWISGD